MSLAESIAQHDADDATTLAQLDQARADLTDAQAQRDSLAVERDQLAARCAVLLTQVDQLTAELEATKTHTLFGADAEGTTLAGQTAKVTKWGKGLVVRQFFTGFTQVAPRSADVARVHASWKPTSVAAITDAAVKAACVNLRAGDVVEVWHEADAKVNKGTLAFTEAAARKNAFHDAVKRVRPDLRVANTLTGWTLDPKSGSDVNRWGTVRADLLGADCDGIHSWPYPNYDDEIVAARAFLTKFPAYTGWCVPEFGTSRQSADTVGSVRAAWASDYAAKFEAAGAEHVCLYEHESTAGNTFSTAAEVDAWSTLI